MNAPRVPSPPRRDALPTPPAGAADVAWALGVFAELVAEFGPLMHLRLGGPALAEALGPLPAHVAPETVEQAIEQRFREHIGKLVNWEFLDQFERTLKAFCAQPYVDESHQVAARAALALTPRPERLPVDERDVPALYPIFRAQLRTAWQLPPED